MNRNLTHYWKEFGERRFTKADLWRAFGGGFPGFPTPEWLAALDLSEKSWIETAPGPRGGEGWRLTADAVSSMRKRDAEARVKADRLDLLLKAVSPPLGSVYIDDEKLKWTFFGLGCRSFSLAFRVNSKVDTVQRALDHSAIEIKELAKREREKHLAEIAKLDKLIAQVDCRVKPGPDILSKKIRYRKR